MGSGIKNRKKAPMGDYVPTDEEVEAYVWCINNGIKIAPLCKENGSSWYVEVILPNKTPKRSPEAYKRKEIWEKIFEFYTFYYDKKAKAKRKPA